MHCDFSFTQGPRLLCIHRLGQFFETNIKGKDGKHCISTTPQTVHDGSQHFVRLYRLVYISTMLLPSSFEPTEAIPLTPRINNLTVGTYQPLIPGHIIDPFPRSTCAKSFATSTPAAAIPSAPARTRRLLRDVALPTTQTETAGYRAEFLPSLCRREPVTTKMWLKSAPSVLPRTSSMLKTLFGHGLKGQTPRKLNRAHSSRRRRRETTGMATTTARKMSPRRMPHRDRPVQTPRKRSFVLPKTFGGRGTN